MFRTLRAHSVSSVATVVAKVVAAVASAVAASAVAASAVVCGAAAAAFAADVETLSPHLRFSAAVAGEVNSALVSSGDGRRHLAVYAWSGPERVEQLLMAHGRRDVLRSPRQHADRGATLVAPARSEMFLKNPQSFWDAFQVARFHDYGQQSTKIAGQPLPVRQWVKDGERVEWQGLSFQVLETPGFTRDSVTYLAPIDGIQVAFTGDLIYGDGQILDLYSFQDAIPDAQIRGYHGYGSRLAELVESLQKVAAAKPDLLVPARGPVIRNPAEALSKLTGRVQAVYRNYLSTNALHWYFKAPRMRQCGERVLGKGAEIELMPYSHHEATPNWVFEHSTSRLLISDSGHAFLLDCGYQRVIDAIVKLQEQGVVKDVEGLFVTHFHDDHTDMVQAAAEKFGCPVYATPEYADVLERPAAYHLPAMTANPIRNIHALRDGHKMAWREFELTFHFFPGQTHYHGGMLADKKGEPRPIFFIGDAFAPSGIDDYCVLNRNLIHPDAGYFLCFEKLRKVGRPFWLVNEHIPFVFSYTDEEQKYLRDRYQARAELLRELFPWDDPNYGIDEQWAVCYPYGATRAPGAELKLELRLENHSPQRREFHAELHLPDGWTLARPLAPVTLDSRQTGAIHAAVKVGARSGLHLITADVRSAGMEFHSWVESMVTVE